MRGMFLVFARRRQVDLVGISAKLRRERDVCINIGSFDDCYLRSVLVPTLRLPKEFLRFIEASVRVIPMSANSRPAG